ncbi:methyltransferase domain-containing protein [Paenibacillus sp. GCM10027627]
MMTDRLMGVITEGDTNPMPTVAGKAPFHILEIGCGTGALTERLIRKWPDATVLSLDLSSNMLHAAERRISGTFQGAAVRFLQADVEKWSVDASPAVFDLIVSSACFQWLHDAGKTLKHLRKLLKPSGRLAFATFGPDTFRELHQAFGDAYLAQGLKPQRHGLTFCSATEWQRLLAAGGYERFQLLQELMTEQYASPRKLLHSIKGMGASTTEAGMVEGLSLRRLFEDMYGAYDDKFRLGDGVAATYEAIYIQAFQ